MTPDRATDLIREMFAEGVIAVDPHVAVTRSTRLDGEDFVTPSGAIDLGDGRVIAVSIGKAAVPMAAGLVEVLGDRIERGSCLTKDGQAVNWSDPRFRIAVASHPVPDERGVAATREIVDLISGLGPHDVVIALISGGGSALFEAPRDPLSLADIQATTSLLLNAGAPIQDLNAVRSELSLVKGGGFRRAIGRAACVSLILSDVLGNDPTVIASGPTVPREPNPVHALELLDRYRLRSSVPAAVITLLEESTRQPTRADNSTLSERDVWSIVGDNALFLASMKGTAERHGLATEIVWRDREGEASKLARQFVELCAGMSEDVDCVLGGGEATVTVSGGGIGGRNTEFALAAAIELAERNLPWTIASLASDGDDGANERAAGGIVDMETVLEGGRAGLDARSSLDRNDSGTYLRAVNALFASDATGTNVNDAYIGIRSSN